MYLAIAINSEKSAMKSTLFFIPLFVTLFFKISAFGDVKCETRKSTFGNSKQIAQQQCETTKKSPQCQQLYAKIKEDGGDLSAKALRCEVDSDLSLGQKLAVSYIACLKGGVVDGLVGSVVDLGKLLGETAAKIHISLQKDAERQKYCDQHPEMKEKIFTVYNESVPKLLRVAVPKNFAAKSCAQLEADLYHARSFQQRTVEQKVDFKYYQKNPKLNPDEQDYLNFKFKKQSIPENKDQSLMNMADGALEQWGIHIDCYNLEARMALRCEALFAVASIGYGGGKAALSALSGLKAERFAAQVSKVAQEAGSLKKMSEADKLKILTSASRLSESQRVQAGESLLGRALTSEQATAIKEAHRIGMGKGTRKYSSEELRLKADKLRKAGFTSEERETLMRSGITGEFDDYVRAANTAQANEEAMYRLIQQSERRKFEIGSKLKSGKLSEKEKLDLEQELLELDNKIASSRESIFGGSVIGPGNGPVDLARVERHVGFVSREIEIVEANGGKVAGLVERRAKGLREVAEFKAMGKNYSAALKDYDLAARDVERALAEGGLKSYSDQVAALRILENAGSSQYREAYQKLAAQVARSPQVTNRVVVPEKMEFGSPVVNPVVAREQQGGVWQMVRDYKDQNLRIEIQRARNEDLAGHSWEKNQKMNAQFESMIERREGMAQVIEQKIRQEYGNSGASKAQKLIEELGLR